MKPWQKKCRLILEKGGGNSMSKSIKVIEGILQDEKIYTLIELSEITITDQSFLQEMIECGIIEPAIATPVEKYDYQALKRVQKAIRLHRDLAINLEGISLVLDLLDEVQALEQELVVYRRR
jgi:chaperone modulatory protein CbpM